MVGAFAGERTRHIYSFSSSSKVSRAIVTSSLVSRSNQIFISHVGKGKQEGMGCINLQDRE